MPRRYTLQDSQSPSQPTSQPTQQPSHVNTRAFTRGMALIEDLEQQRRDKLARFTTVRQEEPDEDADSNSPIYDAFLSTQGPEGIFSLTNFSPSEFDLLWADLRHFVSKNWNVGSGRKSEVTARDLLLMMLASMKHCGKSDVVALVFSQKPPTFEKRVLGYIKAVHPFFMRSYVAQLAEQWSMKNLIASGNQFKNFPFARYATDVTFQQTNTPCGSYAEKKHYYSGKHSLYGHKVEISVVPNGFAIFCTEHYKGSISDKTIFDENVDVHKAGLAKQQDETLLADPNREHTSWAVLADKGYQGIQHEVRAVLPSKKPKGGILTFEEQRRNDAIASDRVVVENFFGRMKTLWAVCTDKYRWSRQNYDVIFQTGVALTNVHIRFHPLKDEDGDVNTQYINRLNAIGTKLIKDKRKASQKHKKKRKARLSMCLAGGISLAADHAGSDGSDTELGSQLF
ncbi:hypothetical protein B5M09_011706 [Aphanomyces astaci]|uniref:DDE Tnp4 domain-containing protein n=2 Tax=Aphanomyces astaci TaxID=112090 RepID=A0A3R7WQN0_APHAT|nr:hypothetical protein B5M09_011706 [Aphanomyces astaci]